MANQDRYYLQILGRIELEPILFYSGRSILIFKDALKLHSFISIFDVKTVHSLYTKNKRSFLGPLSAKKKLFRVNVTLRLYNSIFESLCEMVKNILFLIKF